MLQKFSVQDDVNTSEAYSGSMFIGAKGVVIPYINLHLMPGNNIMGRQCIIDYSYYVLLGVKRIALDWPKSSVELDLNQSSDSELMTEYVALGDYRSGAGCADVKIVCADLALYIPDTSQTRDNYLAPFVPIDTPNFSRNLPVENVEAFFKLENLPEEIQKDLGGNLYAFTIK